MGNDTDAPPFSTAPENPASPRMSALGLEDEAAEREIEIGEKDIESKLLEQLQELHRQLAEVRTQSKREEHERRLFQEDSKLIVCANKIPVRLTKATDGGGSWKYDEYKGRFRSAIESLAVTNRVQWVSWPGSSVDFGSQEAVRKKLDAEFKCTPVFLSPEIADLFYNKFCHGVLWPLLHCINSDNFNEGLLESFMEQYEAYQHANQMYLEVAADIYQQGDLVLVLDYELMLLPMMLRKRFPDIVCGFFLHCPFPSSEFYRMLPVRQNLLQGMLGADLVSFNHFDYVRHFLNSCTRILGLESFPSRIEHNGRLVSLSICPAGIQPEYYEITPDVQRHIDLLKSQNIDLKIIVSMDRLDVSKGIPQKLMALESLLENYPEWRGKVIMFAIIRDRKRTEDRELSRVVDGLVGRVNGRFGYADYCPVNYVKRDLMNEEVIALNAIADVKLVTSIREGINLGAMEFIACQQQTRHGVLVYSEFAGCSTDFKGALIVNPYDADKVAESINIALTMSSTTKQIRNHQLSRYVNTYTSALWARRIISSLQQAGEKAREYNQLQQLNLQYLQAFYERSKKRLFVFDYDGTLAPYHSLPQLAAPQQEVLQALETLCEDPANAVFVISGRKKEDLQDWLGCIRNLALIAENGFWMKIPSDMMARCNAFHGVEEGMDVSATSQASTARGSPRGSPPSSMITANHINPSLPTLNLDVSLGGFLPEQPPSADLDTDAASWALESTCGSVFCDQITPLGTMADGWVSKGAHVDLSWKEEVMDILESFTERTPGSFLEIKDSCMSWHYRDADPDFGMSQAKNLHQHLDQMLKHQPVRVITCPTKKYIVIHPARLNKGRILMHVMQDFGPRESAGDSSDFDFILAIGDERTDEDMFDVLQGSHGFAMLRRTAISKYVPGTPRGHCFTVTVGRKISRAQYYVDDPKEVLRVLQVLSSVSQHMAHHLHAQVQVQPIMSPRFDMPPHPSALEF